MTLPSVATHLAAQTVAGAGQGLPFYDLTQCGNYKMGNKVNCRQHGRREGREGGR